MICPFCKNDFFGNVNFCSKCGSELKGYISFLNIKSEVAEINTSISMLQDTVGRINSRLSEMEGSVFKPIVAPASPEPKLAVLPQEEQVETVPELPMEPERFEQSEVMPVIQAEPQPEETFAAEPGQPVSMKPKVRPDFEVRFGQKWLLIAGIVFTVLAFGWFLKYSFDRNWVGPFGRVLMTYLAGLAFLGAGEWFRRKKLDTFGLYLAGGGIAILYFASFAGFAIFHLITQPAAFGLMVVVTALACALSLFYDTKWLSVLGLIGGFITPVVLSTGVDSQVALMSYMTLLNAGILTIAFFRQWKLLNYLGFACTWFLFAGWYGNFYSPEKFWRTLIFLNIFSLTYILVPFVYHLKKEHQAELKGIGLTVLNSFVALGYSIAMIREYSRIEYAGIVTVFYAAIFAGMAQNIFKNRKEQSQAFVMVLANAMLFLILTVPVIFSKQWITVFWALQAVVILWAAVKLRNRLLYGASAIMLVLVTGKFYIYDMYYVFNFDFLSWTFAKSYADTLVSRLITTVIVLGSMFQYARMVSRTDAGMLAEPDEPGIERGIFWAVFIIGLFATFNFETSAFFYEYVPAARFASISVLWTLFSIGLIIMGFMKNKVILRHTAIGLFGITMLKVFFWDMSNVSTPWRIVSFLILGGVLIGASYLYYKFKDRILPDEEKEL